MKALPILRKICAGFTAIAILALYLPYTRAVTSLDTGTDTLGDSNASATSSHSIAFTTVTNLDSGDKIELFFPDFTMALDAAGNVSVSTGPTTATASYSNAEKTITLTLTEAFTAGNVVVDVVDGKITNPAVAGEYSVGILTLDSSDEDAALDSGIAKAEIDNEISVVINVAPVVTNVTTSKADGKYWIGTTIPIQIIFSGEVLVTGTPELALNSGGTAYYASGSGTSTLTFNYTVSSGDDITSGSGLLDYSATDSLTLAGGTIGLANGEPAIRILATPSTTNSLSYNNNIHIGPGINYVEQPDFISFEIEDSNGETTDSTPVLKFEAEQEAARVALSCNGGVTWTDWIAYPDDGKLNDGTIADFNILNCGAEKGLKTIHAKIANSNGYESVTLEDSTIYTTTATTQTVTTEEITGAETVTTEKETTGTLTETKTVSQTINVSETTQAVAQAENKIIEIGYVNKEYSLWKSFRNTLVDESGQVTVEAPRSATVEIRVIDAERMERYAISTGQATSNEITVEKPIVPVSGGKIPVSVKLNSTSTVGASVGSGGGGGSAAKKASVEIPAETKVLDDKEEAYEGIIYPPEELKVIPSSVDGKINVEKAIFVGSSSGNIKFDKPVKVNIPKDNGNGGDWKIYYFDENLQDWVITKDAVTGVEGGELSADGTTISIWVDHMTIFGIAAEVKEVSLLGIKRIAAGGDVENRAKFSSGQWFSPADVGNDDRVSFAWSGTGDRFYYVLDDNPFPTSLKTATSTSKSTTNFFVDQMQISEGESFFHILPESSSGERGDESVFVLNYDKTPPELETVSLEEGKLKLTFSEEITTPDVLSFYFASGETVEIPAISSPTAETEIDFEFTGNANEIISIVGMLIDRSGLITINPSTLAQTIRNMQLSVLHPAQLVEGKYFTKNNFVSVIPSAEGAVKMRLAAKVLGVESGWMNYSQNEVRVPLDEFGAQRVVMEFSDKDGAIRKTGVIVTRLPASSAELAKMQKEQTETLASIRENISTKLKSLFTWGVKSDLEEVLEESNPAVLPTAEVPSAEEIEELNEVLMIAQKVRAEATTANPSLRKIVSLGEKLLAKNFTLDDFLTVSEIDLLLGKIDADEAQILRNYLDANSIVLTGTREVRAGPLSLGMRDSDNDGLSDLLEIEIGTNPFLVDSDGDGNSDGIELLSFDSNPLEKDLPVSAGFVGLTEEIENPQPLFRGLAGAGDSLELVATSKNGNEIFLGKTKADTEGRWLLRSDISIPAENYDLSLRKGNETIASQQIEINLDFILLPPKIDTGTSNVFATSQPAFLGNTFYGSRVVAFFDNSPTAVVVDNSLGDFVLRPSQNLEVGKHTLVAFTELKDGSRSPARVIEFEVTENMRAAAWKLFSPRNYTIVGIILIAALFYHHRRKLKKTWK